MANLDFEGEILIKWQNHEVDTFIAIRRDMEKEFVKSTIK
jgi:hypothetical protein